MSTPAVSVQQVSKRFRLGASHDSIRDLVTSAIRRLTHRETSKKESTDFWAIRDVSFEAAAGEALGIIGPNGAGKSTILRLLAGILTPDGGNVNIQGRLAALIEVGAGFHGDLTGRENIFLNGAILGMSRDEVKQKLDAIVDFAGIGRFLDMPVKRYSSGMYARLGFSIAVHVDPQVLLVDEVLSVGDAVFRLRCMERMRELVAKGTTLLFVTHNLEQMQAICHRTIVLEKGQVAFEGEPSGAVGRYTQAVMKSYAARPTDSLESDNANGELVQIKSLRFLNENAEAVDWIKPNRPVRVEMTFDLSRPVARLVAELNLRASSCENLLSFNSGRDNTTFATVAGEQTISLSLPSIPLAGGQYFWNLRMWDADAGTTLLDTPLCYPLMIDDGGRTTGMLALDREWGHATSPIEVDKSTVTKPLDNATHSEEPHENLRIR